MSPLDEARSILDHVGIIRKVGQNSAYKRFAGVAYTISPKINLGVLSFRDFQDPLAISHRGHSEGVCRWRVASRTGAAP
jgi:hypothetical protein